VNRLLTKKEISNVIDMVYRHCGQKETVIFCDRLMAIGFQQACKAVEILLLVPFTLLCARRHEVVLRAGMMRSSLPKEMPALHACWKPIAISRSQRMTVSFCPAMAVDHVDDVRDLLLGEEAVHQIELDFGCRGRMSESQACGRASSRSA